MYMRKILFYLFLLTVTGIQANPVDDILERIDKGASRKFQHSIKRDFNIFHPIRSNRNLAAKAHVIIIKLYRLWIKLSIQNTPLAAKR